MVSSSEPFKASRNTALQPLCGITVMSARDGVGASTILSIKWILGLLERIVDVQRCYPTHRLFFHALRNERKVDV